MRREHYAARVPRPRFEVHRGVVFRQKRIARVAENAFDEVEVAYERPGSEKADFHSLFAVAVGDCGADRRAQIERNPRFRLLLLSRCKWKLEHFFGSVEHMRPEVFEDRLGDGFLVGGHGESALGDVEDPRSRAPVVVRVVQNPLTHAVGGYERALVGVAIGRKREHSRRAESVEYESLVRELWNALALAEGVGEIGLQKVHNARVRGAEVFRRVGRKFAVVLEQGLGELDNRVVVFAAENGKPRRRQPHIDVLEKRLAAGFVCPSVGVDSKCRFVIH